MNMIAIGEDYEIIQSFLLIMRFRDLNDLQLYLIRKTLLDLITCWRYFSLRILLDQVKLAYYIAQIIAKVTRYFPSLIRVKGSIANNVHN